MKILVSGSTGLVGSAVVSSLEAEGCDVLRLLRPPSRATALGPSVHWDPEAGTVESEGLQGIDAAVHLAGENIATGRWTAAKKARIRDSRVKGTRVLSEALASVEPAPKALVSASAVGIYGDRGDEVLTESSPPGEGFLADVCGEWEAATRPAEDAGIRVVHLRVGVVLSQGGGALARMLTPFRLGLGGKVGSGRQYLSWIVLDDLCAVVRRALEDDGLRGAVNAVSPNPVTNLEFTKALARALSRPAVFPMPGLAARLAFGEMAEELLLASARVRPEILLKGGHEFLHAEIEGALKHALS